MQRSNANDNLLFSFNEYVEIRSSEDIFEDSLKKIKQKSYFSFSTRVAHAFNKIYRYQYPKNNKKNILPEKNEIARPYHGIQHVTNAAIYAQVFVNLYKLFGDKEALELTNNDIHLIQEVMLYHDSERLAEGEDLWDKESAVKVYYILTEELQVDSIKAKKLAEALANKEYLAFQSTQSDYYELNTKTFLWEKSCHPPFARNIYQQIIHDADCLHIQRAVEQFNKEYLDFYQKYVLINQGESWNKKALDILVQLVMETNRNIEQQGDSVYLERRNDKIKKNYENENAYLAIISTIDGENYPLLFSLYQNNIKPDFLTQFEENSTSTFVRAQNKYSLENLNALRDMNRVFFRGVICGPGEEKKIPSCKVKELLSEKELRKALRRPHISTRTQKIVEGKAANLGKMGNDFRSISLISDHAKVLYPVGYLIIPKLEEIRLIRKTNIFSGAGKKKNLQHLIVSELSFFSDRTQYIKNGKDELVLIGEGENYTAHFYKKDKLEEIFQLTINKNLLEEINQMTWQGKVENNELKKKIIDLVVAEKNRMHLEKVALHMKIGRSIHSVGTQSMNTEIIALITEHGPAAFTLDIIPDLPMVHPYARILHAIYLEKERQKYYGEEMPIFEFSAHWKGLKARKFEKNEIKKMWKIIIADYIKGELINKSKEIFTLSTEQIKIRSMFGTRPIFVAGKIITEKIQPGDIGENEGFRMELDNMIDLQRKNHIKEYIKLIIDKIRDVNISIFSYDLYDHLLFIKQMVEEIKFILKKDDEIKPDQDIFSPSVKELLLKKICVETDKLANKHDLWMLKNLVDEFNLSDSVLPEIKKSAIHFAILKIKNLDFIDFDGWQLFKKFIHEFKIDKDQLLLNVIKEKISNEINNVHINKCYFLLKEALRLAREFILTDSALEIRKTIIEIAIKDLKRLNSLIYNSNFKYSQFKHFISFIKDFDIKADEMMSCQKVIEEVVVKYIVWLKKFNQQNIDDEVKLIEESKLISINTIIQNTNFTLMVNDNNTDCKFIPRI